MKTTTVVKVPTVSPKGKALKLTLDHETAELAVEIPFSLHAPRVAVAELERASRQIADLLPGHTS